MSKSRVPWQLEVWYRNGPQRSRRQPETRVLVWSGETHAMDATSACCVAADACKLRPQDWCPPGQVRPPYVIRAWQDVRKEGPKRLTCWPPVKS